MAKKITRQPTYDERHVVPPYNPREPTERIYLIELAQFLHVPTIRVRKWARRQELIRKQGMGGAVRSIEYVTQRGAMRIIAHFRAIQGEEYLKGKDFHARLDAVREYRKKVG